MPLAAVLVMPGCKAGGLSSGAGASATAGPEVGAAVQRAGGRVRKWSTELTNIDPYTPPADGVIAVYAVPADKAGALDGLAADARPLRTRRHDGALRPSFAPSPGVTYVGARNGCATSTT